MHEPKLNNAGAVSGFESLQETGDANCRVAPGSRSAEERSGRSRRTADNGLSIGLDCQLDTDRGLRDWEWEWAAFGAYEVVDISLV